MPILINHILHPFSLRLFLWMTVTLLSLSSCIDTEREYLIGVSQCSEDSWRTKLATELEQATYFNENVRLVLCTADDDMEKQSRQIDSLISLKVDLLIVSPQQVSKLSSAIKHATDANIPVILFDRRSDVKNYTAFMGANNYNIGRMMAQYAASQLGGKGNIIEIAGEHASSPAIERHQGFIDALKQYPDMHIIGFGEGDWKQPSGERAMDSILNNLEKQHGKIPVINCVFGGNDRMAVGARMALERYIQTHHTKGSLSQDKGGDPIYLGIDALPTPGGGIEQVRDGILTASAIYPTHGDELMQLALNILKGEQYKKETDMETSIVTSANANVLLMQNKEITNQHLYIKRMYARVDKTLSMLNAQRTLLFFIIIVVMIVSSLLVITVKANRMKHKLNEELHKKNEELNLEKEKVERQRDELEEQRDKLLDATSEPTPDIITAPASSIPPTTNASQPTVPPRNEFMEKFLTCVDSHISDADLSVEDIGQQMCLSRVQLYRKVKALTGKTPVEIIREERLKRARILLQDSSLTISEVAYRVGFSAPSYFAKCYKEYYGKSPSDK